ncbi:unnamed protein product [Hymenolepis diminuta]|uniref:Tubby C-terminal domain-containing protein n=1 Tax=Hymenolepis diminuta TaxID=6216 RepID=A0A3P6YCR9_HYMDI|nr:unnamed protein product [Hymenolepis diminuta]
MKNSETITRRRRKRDKQISARSEEGKLREKRKSPANFNSSISVTKRRSNKRSTTGRPKREKAIAQTEIKSAPRKSKSTVKEDRSEAVNDILLQNEDMESKGGPRKIKMGIRDSSPRKATHILYTAESCLGDFKPPQQKKLTKSSSENCIPKIVIEKSENRKPSHAGKTEFKKKERDSIVKDDTYSDVELRSAVARIFKAVDQVESFIRSPAPKGMTIRCRITRDKHGIEGGLFPSYYLFLERREDRRRFFLLSARRKRRAATCTYLISMDAINTPSGEKLISDTVCSNSEINSYNFANGGKMSMGFLRSNFLGTQFVLIREAIDSNGNLSSEEWNREIAAIAYEPNLLGFKGPRKMTVLLRSENDLECSTSSKELSKYLAGLPDSRDDSSGILELHNKKPMWNEGCIKNYIDYLLFNFVTETQSYVLNFHGRVTQASVKNFQLIDEKDESKVLMQFGRVSDKHFTMDYSYPLSALQAFGIAISSLTGKLACE